MFAPFDQYVSNLLNVFKMQEVWRCGVPNSLKGIHQVNDVMKSISHKGYQKCYFPHEYVNYLFSDAYLLSSNICINFFIPKCKMFNPLNGPLIFHYPIGITAHDLVNLGKILFVYRGTFFSSRKTIVRIYTFVGNRSLELGDQCRCQSFLTYMFMLHAGVSLASARAVLKSRYPTLLET